MQIGRQVLDLDLDLNVWYRKAQALHVISTLSYIDDFVLVKPKSK